LRNPRWAALFLLSALAMAQVSSELITPEIRRVGSRLACLCKSCKNSVGDCAMLACHYSKPAREKIRDMQAAGKPDDTIVDSFVADQGRQALVVPPNDGFMALAWWMPPMVVGMRKPGTLTPLPVMDAKTRERYQDTIEKDLAKLD
jgi:cytochrome c-type biogenesis protein CcmH/NrfF